MTRSEDKDKGHQTVENTEIPQSWTEVPRTDVQNARPQNQSGQKQDQNIQDGSEEADVWSRMGQMLIKTAMTKQTACGCVPTAAIRNVWFSSEAKKNISNS